MHDGEVPVVEFHTVDGVCGVFPHGGDDPSPVDIPVDSGFDSTPEVEVLVLAVEPLQSGEGFRCRLQFVSVRDDEVASVRGAGGAEADDIGGGGFPLAGDAVGA